MGAKYITVAGAIAWDDRKDRLESTNPWLFDFAEAICSELKAEWSPRDEGYHTAYIYRPNELYTLGYVGYGDFYEDTGNGRNREPRYMVYSENIKNERYSYHCNQYFMTMVKSLNSGVAKARTYMRTVQPAQAVRNEYRNLRESANEIRREAAKEYHASARPLADGFMDKAGASQLQNELLHLRDIGHKWLDPSFATNLDKYFGVIQENKAAFANTYTAVFVDLPRREHEEPKYIVTRDVSTNHYSAPPIKDEQVTVYDQHTMPEELGNKVHALNILAEGQFVPDVGMHAVKGRLFYVAE